MAASTPEATPTQLGRADLDAAPPAMGPSLSQARAAAALGIPGMEVIPNKGDLVARLGEQEAEAVIERAMARNAQSQRFLKLLGCFGFFMFLVALTTLGLLIWLIVTFAQAEEESGGQHKECDVPLWTWAAVVIATWSTRVLLKYCTDHCLCCWWPTPENKTPPWRVHIKECSILLFEFIWVVIMGWVWISADGDGDEPACKDVMPNMYEAAKVYIAFNTAVTVFLWISSFGLLTIIKLLMPHHSSREVSEAEAADPPPPSAV